MTDNTAPSLYEAFKATGEGARELAAADAASQAQGLVEEALHVSGMSQKDLATALELTEGRVSQVLNGDGNFRVGVLATYLNALGYNLTISATPKDAGKPTLPLPKRGRRRKAPEPEVTRPNRHWRTRILDAAFHAYSAVKVDSVPGIIVVAPSQDFPCSSKKWSTSSEYVWVGSNVDAVPDVPAGVFSGVMSKR